MPAMLLLIPMLHTGVALSEPYATALLLLAMGILFAVSVLFSRAADRVGIPVILLFLILGMLGGSEGIGRLGFDNYALAVRIGTVALVLILFDGGLGTSAKAFRQVLLPASLLATVGVAVTAGLVALCARLLGIPWTEALLCLLPLRFPLKDISYIGWVGLRGAVPIIRATFPVLAGVHGAGRIFNLVFIIVVISNIIPGMTVRWVTRWLGLIVPEKAVPSAIIEINAMHQMDGEITSYYIDPTLAVSGARLCEIEFPPGASVTLIVRGQHLLPPKGDSQLLAGDHVYVFFREEDRPFIELLFGTPEQ